jgi:hypothetical protein
VGRKPHERGKGLANASVNTSVRGGSHDGQVSKETPANLGLPGDDQQAGLEAAEGQTAPKPPETRPNDEKSG